MSTIADLATEIQQTRVEYCAHFATLTLVIYDILMTLDQEIDLVWKSPLSLTKVLYLLNRYGTLAMRLVYEADIWGIQMTDKSCFILCVVGNMALFLITTCAGSGLVFLRVFALYKNYQAVIIFVGFLLLAQLVVGVTAITLDFMRFQIAYVGALGSCSVLESWSQAWSAWIAMVVFDATVFGLICFRTWEHVRNSIRTPVLSCVLRDGTLYFAVVLAVELVSVMGYLDLKGPVAAIGVAFTFSLPSMMVSRIFLNLRTVTNPGQWASATNAWTVRNDSSLHDGTLRRRAEDTWDTDDDVVYG